MQIPEQGMKLCSALEHSLSGKLALHLLHCDFCWNKEIVAAMDGSVNGICKNKQTNKQTKKGIKFNSIYKKL